MINSSKINTIAVLFLVGFALIPGWFEEFDVGTESSREIALAACALFLAGLLVGSRLIAAPRPWTAAEQRADRGEQGLRLFGMALLLCTAYVLLFGPTPPIFAAATGFDAFDSALLREEALKLNSDILFVKLYSYTRDILSPIVFVLAVEALFKANAERSKRILWIVLIAVALFIGIWSGQKATIINYLVAATVFVARDARSLLRWLLWGAPVLAALTFAMFAITYPGIFSDLGAWQALSNVAEGLVHRIYVSPFEVSIAYVDAVDNQRLVTASHVVPYLSQMLPGPTIENEIGLQYFYTGIESVSANALCFAYAYVLGGLPACFLSGVLTTVVLTLSIRMVRQGGSIFMARAFQAMIAYRLLDLLNANIYSYLNSLVQLAFIAWILARADVGRTRRRRLPAPAPAPVPV